MCTKFLQIDTRGKITYQIYARIYGALLLQNHSSRISFPKLSILKDTGEAAVATTIFALIVGYGLARFEIKKNIFLKMKLKKDEAPHFANESKAR